MFLFHNRDYLHLVIARTLFVLNTSVACTLHSHIGIIFLGDFEESVSRDSLPSKWVLSLVKVDSFDHYYYCNNTTFNSDLHRFL